MEIIDGIGVLKPQKQGKNAIATILDEGRGIAMFSRVQWGSRPEQRGIRVEVIPGDGLPNYHFDLRDDIVDRLKLMLDD